MVESLIDIKEIMGDFHFPNLNSCSDYITDSIREITVTLGKPVIFCAGNEFFYKDKYTGYLTKNHYDANLVDEMYINKLLCKLTCNSPYLYQNTLLHGYIPYKKGIRISVAGDGYSDFDKMSTINRITTLSFRVSKKITGIADGLMDYITDGNIIYNTLIISPPACGKTTLLRDIARNLSFRFRTGIADEREEIVTDDVGILSMVIKGIPKKDAFDMFIRNASADVIICDEIGGALESELILSATKRGVSVVATAHGSSLDDIKTNPLTKCVFDCFDTFLTLSSQKGKGIIKEIYFKGDKCLVI